MKRKKLFRVAVIVAISGALTGGGSIYYMFNMPHRDVLGSEADYSLASSEIVSEYLADKRSADEKYLSADGNSRILSVTGTVNRITENYNDDKVILLKGESDKAGVSATFTAKTNHKLEGIEIGSKVTVKGVIRSGASYDEDLGLYEHVILEKSDLITQQ